MSTLSKGATVARQGDDRDTPSGATPDPVAEAAALLGPDLQRYMDGEHAPSHDTTQTEDPDASLDEPTMAFDVPEGLFRPPDPADPLQDDEPTCVGAPLEVLAPVTAQTLQRARPPQPLAPRVLSVPKPPRPKPPRPKPLRPKPLGPKPIGARPLAPKPKPLAPKPKPRTPTLRARPVVVAPPRAPAVTPPPAQPLTPRPAQPVVVGPPRPAVVGPARPTVIGPARPAAIGPVPKATPVAVPAGIAAVRSESDRQRRRPTAPFIAPFIAALNADATDAPGFAEAVPSVILSFDDESAAVTNIFTEAQAPDRPRGRLAVSSGPNKGKIWYLNRPVTTLGRAQTNDIVIMDGSISRTHVRIERHADGFRLVDAGSVNGIWLNSAKVTREELHDGDALLLGDLVLTFSTVGQPRTRATVRDRVTNPGRAIPISPGRRRIVPKSWLVAWITTTAVAVAVTISATNYIRQRNRAQVRAEAETHRREAQSAVERRAWAQARDALQTARGVHATLLDYESELARIDTAQRHEAVMALAQSALSAGAYAQVQALLAPIDDASAYAVDARALRRRAQTLLKQEKRERAAQP
jgi:pSer/pThr/pTyr-binding forkhead associated (FHA) protein